MEKQNGRYQCFRCGSMIDQKLWKLSEEVLYCRACIQLGRIQSDQKLYAIAQQDFEGQEVLNWKGTLTSYQQEVSEGLIQAVKAGKHALVHAVTGAGENGNDVPSYSNSYQGRKSSLYCYPKNRCLY